MEGEEEGENFNFQNSSSRTKIKAPSEKKIWNANEALNAKVSQGFYGI